MDKRKFELNNFMYDVVIRCKNEEKFLGQTLASIYQQSVKPKKIIIVDNKSHDKSIAIAEKYKCLIIKYNKNKFNYSHALNLGIKKTSEKFILLLSAHCPIVNKDAIKNLLKNFTSKKVSGVYGRQIPTKKSNAIDTRDLLNFFGREKIVYKKYPFFHNAFSIIKRKAWIQENFDIRINGIEDRVWAQSQADNYNKHIVYDPSGVVFHEHGLNHERDEKRATRVCKVLKLLHNKDIKDFPKFKFHK